MTCRGAPFYREPSRPGVICTAESMTGRMSQDEEINYVHVFLSCRHARKPLPSIKCTDSRGILGPALLAHSARRRRPGALMGWGDLPPASAWRSRHLCGRAGRWRARGGQKQPKKRRKRPRRQIRGPNRKSMDRHHGKYHARTCPNRPNAQKIKRRAALADRVKQNGVPGPARKPLKSF